MGEAKPEFEPDVLKTNKQILDWFGHCYDRSVAVPLTIDFGQLPQDKRIEIIRNIELVTKLFRKAHRRESGSFERLNKKP